MYKSKYFKAYELVPADIFNKRGEAALELIDPRLLITLDQLREKLQKPITINNYKWNGAFSQRGLRSRSFYKSDKDYQDSLSQHKYGRAVDFDVKGMTAQQVREFIHANRSMFPYITFIETDVNWVHVDVRNGDYRIWSPTRGFVNVP
ncbi:D-Ala-D-Ala carboxypeptidase family metallohydrolase [Vibrio vulnificus]|uniref:D-Ala-D-Ala carboxypeptidase family metallohydrolase n=1 Tax=Vibrio vulnificus TaxID=672 RepID=UPI003242867A